MTDIKFKKLIETHINNELEKLVNQDCFKAFKDKKGSKFRELSIISILTLIKIISIILYQILKIKFSILII